LGCLYLRLHLQNDMLPITPDSAATSLTYLRCRYTGRYLWRVDGKR
jgi:hypothetical protein